MAPPDLVRYVVDDAIRPFQHGQGQVVSAHDLLFDDHVALKYLRADLAGDVKATATFRKEAAAGARLSRISRHIVPVRDFGRAGDILYFAMDWIGGGSLENRCGRLSFRSAKSYLRQILDALRVAHSQGVVHSDVAPSNVLLDDVGQAYLADFGYLKILDEVLISRGEKSLLIGYRPYYLPPAHLLNPSRINQSSDVYATALTFHRLLTGGSMERGDDGRLIVPGIIDVKAEVRSAPVSARALVNRFVAEWTDADTVDELGEYLDRIP